MRHEQGKIVVLHNNDDLVGFAMFSPNLLYAEMRILQIWIRDDARLILHGRALIDDISARSWPQGIRTLRLWCATDLAANLFWKALGFRYRGWRFGSGGSKRRHVLWMRRVNPPLSSLERMPPAPQVERIPPTQQPSLFRLSPAD